MSAFLVSNAHINVLLTFAQHHRLVLPHPEAPKTCSVEIYSAELATEVGRALLRENFRSLAFRYGDNHGLPGTSGGGDAHLQRYQFKPDCRALNGQIGSIAIIKATHCFDYQSCETPDYLSSWAAEFMRMLREAACHHLPGYDQAPWGFEDPGRH